MARPADFMVMVFDRDALFFHQHCDFRTETAQPIIINDETKIVSIGDLAEHDGILLVEPVEVDYDYLDSGEEYCNKLSGEHSDLLEYNRQELIRSDQILCFRLRYVSGDAEVIGYISLPADYETARYPVLIYNRGGNGEFSKLESPEVQLMARYGFVVLASQYRGVDGGTGMDHFGGDDVDDVIKLIDFAELFGKLREYLPKKQ